MIIPPGASAAHVLAIRLVDALGRDAAHRAADVALSKMSVVERAALATHWPTWAMPMQLPPPEPWISWTRLGGRGLGKSLGFSQFINGEVVAGRVRLVGLCAQNEEKTVAIQVDGPSGLIATAPPWNRAEYSSSTKTLRWENGAKAYVLTPEAPAAIRGLDYGLSWLSEVQSWPKPTAEEAFSNFVFATRVGYCKTIIDATPKQRNPLLKLILARSAANPRKHVVTTGKTSDNPHLARDIVDDMIRQYGLDTVKGREELLGEMVEDDAGIIKAEWISEHRRAAPPTFARRVIATDPSITSDPRFSDRSGICDAGVGGDGRLYVVRNLTKHYGPEAFGGVLVDAYFSGRCDLLVIETNRGGNAHTGLVRITARDRGAEVVELGANEMPPPHNARIVYVREVNNRGKKAARMSVAAALLERGRVSFVPGGEGLGALEEHLLTLDGSERGPDDAADAFAMAASELSSATRDQSVRVPVAGFVGAMKRAAVGVDTAVGARHALSPASFAHTLAGAMRGAVGGGGGGERI